MSTRVPSLTHVLLLGSCLSTALPVRADNSPEGALRRFKDHVLAKISYACGVDFSAEYDGASLRKHDEYIAHDQTSGDQECNEPFRYLWFVCQTDAGKTAVRSAGVKGVLCKGSAAKHSTLNLQNGTLVVERADSHGEDKAYVPLRTRFEELLKVKVAFSAKSGPDPYHDQTFGDLMGMPNPSLSKSDYCLVNGERLEPQPLFKLERTRDGQIKCWTAGKLVTDLQLKNGEKTGLVTEDDGRGNVTVSHYKAGKLEGEVRRTRAGKLDSLTHYENGKRVWWQDNEQDGRLIYNTHQYPEGQDGVMMTSDGKVHSLHCLPSAHADKQLREVCGFGSPRTTRVYDGTGKVNRVEVWRDGVLVERTRGDSAYSDRTDVTFKDNKKHGRERMLRDDGTLEQDIQWNAGVKHGRELKYDATGKKIVMETVWREGVKESVTEYYLNGMRKSLQQFDGERGLREQTFWDNGKPHTEATLVACSDRSGYSRVLGFCEHGVVRSYYEDGTKSEEAQYQMGKRHGARHAFWPNGKPQAQEQFADDTMVKAKRWNESGKVVMDDEFEADGSRKQRR